VPLNLLMLGQKTQSLVTHGPAKAVSQSMEDLGSCTQDGQTC